MAGLLAGACDTPASRVLSACGALTDRRNNQWEH